jgi:hypothetical protein
MFDVTSIEVMVIYMHVVRSSLIRFKAASLRDIAPGNRAHG